MANQPTTGISNSITAYTTAFSNGTTLISTLVTSAAGASDFASAVKFLGQVDALAVALSASLVGLEQVGSQIDAQTTAVDAAVSNANAVITPPAA